MSKFQHVKIILLICIYCSTHCFAQQSFNYGYQYGSQFQIGDLKLFQLPNGGYFLYGGGSGGGYPPGFLAGLNSHGDLLWANDYKYNFAQVPTFESAIIDTDNNVIFAADCQAVAYGNVIKADTLGNFLWTLHFPFVIKRVLLSNDGNYFAIGSKWETMGYDDYDIFVYKIAPDGSVLWGRHYLTDEYFTPYNSYSKIIYDAAITPAGDFLILFDVHGNKAVMKISSSGTAEWLKEYYFNNAWSEGGLKILVLNDGNYLVCGKDYSAPPNHEFSTFRINTDGDVLWSKKYFLGGEASLVNAFQLTDQEVALFGYYTDSVNMSGGTSVLTVDSVGHLQSSFKIETDHGFNPAWLGSISPGRVVMIESAPGAEDTTQVMILDTGFYSPCSYNSILSFTEANDNIAVIESHHMVSTTADAPDTTPLISTPRIMTFEDLCLPTFSGPLISNADLQVFPVPATDLVKITLQQYVEGVTLQLINTLGFKVYESTWTTNQAGDVIDVSKFSSGVYCLALKYYGNEVTRKVVIQH